MNAPDKFTLPDVQSVVDHRNLPIQRVGVKGIVHPVKVQCGNADQGTVARIDMYVGLPATAKGTHMSRFLEILDAHQDALSCGSLRDMMQRMLLRLEADSGFMGFSFPFFVRKAAPVSGVESLMNYEGHLAVEVRDGQTTSTARVVVPVTSLCPCSRNISDYGAHNQRSHITISATTIGELELLDLIRVAETAASCELWGLLKRVDEKYVTERAYDNPKFVEDLVRDVALGLESIPGILAWTVESENFESIHNHSAYALIERDLRTDGR